MQIHVLKLETLIPVRKTLITAHANSSLRTLILEENGYRGADPPDESMKHKHVEGEKQQCVAPKYADLLKNKLYVHDNNKVPPKPVIMVQGEPIVTWKSSEVKALILQENLQYAVIGKFSYGRPEINALRKIIPTQRGIKGEFTIGVMDSRHILIRLNQFEDYMNLLSTVAHHIKVNDVY
ncbi:hypothetical protein FXO37_03130 [Capsicum annuum]|nr:hypothetical protein FXO37_03130 [Capsicum annuum]